MMMRMLHAGGVTIVEDGQRGADDDNPRGYFEDERVKKLAQDADKRWLHGARGHAIKIISFLINELPDDNNYKVLFVRRDLEEVLASQAKMLHRRGEPQASTDDALRTAFGTHLQKVGITLRLRPCFSVRYFEYREVLADPQAHASRVRDFLAMPLDVAAMASAVDAALYRNRRG